MSNRPLSSSNRRSTSSSGPSRWVAMKSVMPVFGNLTQAITQEALGHDIQIGCRLIQTQNSWRANEAPRKGNGLFLPTPTGCAPVPQSAYSGRSGCSTQRYPPQPASPPAPDRQQIPKGHLAGCFHAACRRRVQHPGDISQLSFEDRRATIVLYQHPPKARSHFRVHRDRTEPLRESSSQTPTRPIMPTFSPLFTEKLTFRQSGNAVGGVTQRHVREGNVAIVQTGQVGRCCRLFGLNFHQGIQATQRGAGMKQTGQGLRDVVERCEDYARTGYLRRSMRQP